MTEGAAFGSIHGRLTPREGPGEEPFWPRGRTERLFWRALTCAEQLQVRHAGSRGLSRLVSWVGRKGAAGAGFGRPVRAGQSEHVDRGKGTHAVAPRPRPRRARPEPGGFRWVGCGPWRDDSPTNGQKSDEVRLGAAGLSRAPIILLHHQAVDTPIMTQDLRNPALSVTRPHPSALLRVPRDRSRSKPMLRGRWAVRSPPTSAG